MLASLQTRLKQHGQNLLAAEPGVPACQLESSQRNILPDLSQTFTCGWAGCEQQGWDHVQSFYWHVRQHAEELRGGNIVCRWEGCHKAPVLNNEIFSTQYANYFYFIYNRQFKEDTAISKIKEHLRTHSQEKLVGCPNCGALFANRIKFLDHCVKQRREGSFVCDTCDKRFSVARHLRDHQRSHVAQYQVPHCCTVPLHYGG